MDSFVDKHPPTYQAIISVNYDDGRLFPLTEEGPVCLLPVGNTPLLSLQLNTLKMSGATDIFIVTPEYFHQPLSQFISEFSDELQVEIVAVAEMLGSADAIRAVADKIRGDFIVFNSDTISEINLGELTSMHRLKSADVTMLLATVPIEEHDKKSGPQSLKVEQEDQEYIVMCDDGRVVVKTPALELEEGYMPLSKRMLTRYASTGGVSLRADLNDVGIYVMSHWVVELLVANKKLSTFRSDLIPYLVARQGQPASTLFDSLPGLRHRKRPLHEMEQWLVSMRSTVPTDHIPTISSARNSAGELSDYAVKGDDVAQVSDGDFLRCYAVVVEGPSVNAPVTVSRPLCQNITTIQTYMAMNREFPSRVVSTSSSQPLSCVSLRPTDRFLKKEQSVMGDDCTLGEKVTIKQCSVGKGCIIGTKSKINNCVVMSNVEIGDSCTIQNCVISEGTVIESNCNLNECYVGRHARIKEGSRLKSEALSASSNS
mmetsp:Transcript_11886/g.17969  ORF Transcript_11886/g.17969 Transcript_11886/m.17969 type:complete len:485 (-) Transcript_11886:169-1623(-)